MIVRKKALSRRTVLRGLGVALALPLVDAMVPAFSPKASAAARVKRLSTVYLPNGINMAKWTPATEGALELSPTLSLLAPFRDRLTVVSRLSNLGPTAPLPGESGPHARASGAFLTVAHAKKTEGPDVRAGVSLDQIAAMRIGGDTALPSLELGIEPNDLLGTCDAGYSCTYVNTLCWASDTTPLPMESHPRAVFERLFGDGTSTDPAARRARFEKDRSILDSVLSTISKLERDLGPNDRQKVSQYLTAIREVERRIQVAEQQATKVPVFDRPAGVPAEYEDHVKLMFDLQVLALQADLTRIITFMMAREVSQRTYQQIGVPEAHHAISHHGGRAEGIAQIVKINAYHVSLFRHYLEKLSTTPDGEGTLLDNSIVMYCAGISEGNSHDYDNLPVLLAGGGSGTLKGGRHLAYPKGTPLANLWVTLLDKLGAPVERFGNDTGELSEV